MRGEATMPISEGESSLVLSRDEYLRCSSYEDNVVTLITDLHDSYGGHCGAAWMAYGTFMTTCGKLLVEVANLRAIAIRARKLNAQLFPDVDLEREAVQQAADRRAQEALDEDEPPW